MTGVDTRKSQSAPCGTGFESQHLHQIPSAIHSKEICTFNTEKDTIVNTHNNIVSFITLTDLDEEKWEINPAFITMMRRDTYQPEKNVEMPMTMVYLSTGSRLYAQETPEQIAQLQMQMYGKIMTSFLHIAEDILEQM